MILTEIASRVSSLPVLNWVSPSGAHTVSDEELAGYLRCQQLALEAATEIARHLREGWTEQQAATLLNTYLRDCGVRSFFHRAFIWFGERTRFAGIGRLQYDKYSPTTRVLQPNEVYILDVAPILDGYICDIGYTGCLGENPAFERAQAFLRELRAEIPSYFREAQSGGAVWDRIDARLREAGYDNIHARYPFSVLGHRIHRTLTEQAGALGVLNFGWQSYWEFLSRGLFGQLLNREFRGDLRGLWAIEPHLGDASGFGAKFEEILVVTEGDAYWLADREDELCLPAKRSS